MPYIVLSAQTAPINEPEKILSFTELQCLEGHAKKMRMMV